MVSKINKIVSAVMSQLHTRCLHQQPRLAYQEENEEDVIHEQ